MKKIAIMLGLALACTCQTIQAQTEKPKQDTTRLLDGRLTFIFKDKDSVTGKAPKELTLSPKKKCKRKAFETNWLNFDLGFTNYLDRTPYNNIYVSMPNPTRDNLFLAPLGNPSKNDFELKTGKSINVNFGIVRGQWDLYKHHINLVSGITYDINSYSYKESITWNPKSLLVKPGFPQEEFISRDSMAFKKNKLITNYLQVPLLLKFESNPYKQKKNVTLALGAYAGYLMRVHTKQIYKGSDKKNKEYEDYNITKFQYGLQAEVGFHDVTFYIKRSLTPLAEFGTSQYPVSIGIRLSGN